MSLHDASIAWHRLGATFSDSRYHRRHRWSFDGGLEVPAAASPAAVPPPLTDPAAIDPEEAFVAALSSCHMLWFLAIAAKRGFIVDSYHDTAVGRTDREPSGHESIVEVILRPVVVFSGTMLPTKDQFAALHHEAHDACLIAHSVKAEVRIEPVIGAPNGEPG